MKIAFHKKGLLSCGKLRVNNTFAGIFRSCTADNSPCRICAGFMETCGGIYFKSRPCYYCYCMQQDEKCNKESFGLFEMLCISEIQCTGIWIKSNILIAGTRNTVLVLVKNRDKLIFCQDCLFQLTALLLQFLCRRTAMQSWNERIHGLIAEVEAVGVRAKFL